MGHNTATIAKQMIRVEVLARDALDAVRAETGDGAIADSVNELVEWTRDAKNETKRGGAGAIPSLANVAVRARTLADEADGLSGASRRHLRDLARAVESLRE